MSICIIINPKPDSFNKLIFTEDKGIITLNKFMEVIP